MISRDQLIVYVLEASAIAIVGKVVMGKSPIDTSLFILIATLAAANIVMDLYAPKISPSMRQGTGFGLGMKQVGGNPMLITMQLKQLKTMVSDLKKAKEKEDTVQLTILPGTLKSYAKSLADRGVINEEINSKFENFSKDTSIDELNTIIDMLDEKIGGDNRTPKEIYDAMSEPTPPKRLPKPTTNVNEMIAKQVDQNARSMKMLETQLQGFKDKLAEAQSKIGTDQDNIMHKTVRDNYPNLIKNQEITVENTRKTLEQQVVNLRSRLKAQSSGLASRLAEFMKNNPPPPDLREGKDTLEIRQWKKKILPKMIAFNEEALSTKDYMGRTKEQLELGLERMNKDLRDVLAVEEETEPETETDKVSLHIPEPEELIKNTPKAPKLTTSDLNTLRECKRFLNSGLHVRDFTESQVNTLFECRKILQSL